MMNENCDRLLLLLRPPLRVARHIDQECRILDLGTRVRTDYLHVTLCMLDFVPSLPDWAVPLMRGICAPIAFPPFRIAFDRMTGGPTSILLRPSERIAAVFALHAHLAGAIARTDPFRGYVDRFSPHITLFYRTGVPFDWEIEPISWQVDEFMLVHSRVRRSEHIVLDSWPLRASGSGQGGQSPVDRLLPMALQKRVGL